MDELSFLPATEQARLVREGEVSPVELVETYLERIERLDPELGAFVTVCAEQALADAREKADAPAETPFHGVPIALKDLDTTAGIRTTFSSKPFAENVPDFDLAHVARTRAAGFVVLGKTNTPEFGTTAFTDSPLNGPCRTPWDLGRNAGGSSGGAAAAVAAGLVRDRAGLGRRRLDPDPGLVLRRSSGSRHRAAASRTRRSCPASGSARPAPMARTTLDAAAYLDLVTGYEWGDPFPAAPPERPYVEEIGVEPGRLRIAFTTEAPIETHRRSRVRRRCPRRRRAARVARARRRGGCTRLGRRGADGGLPACLAGDPGALPDRRSDRALGAEPVVSRARARHDEPGLRGRDRPAAAASATDRRRSGPTTTCC